MSNENSELTAQIGDVSTIDFKKVAEKAVELFADQSLIKKDADKVTLKDIELSKSKANTFLDSLAGLVEVQHKIDLISTYNQGFKRSDELEILNSLREIVSIQTKELKRNMEIARGQQDHLIKALERCEDDEEGQDKREQLTVHIGLLRDTIRESVDTGQKLISSTNRLIQLERYSGGKSWGNKPSATSNIKLIDMDSGEEGKGGVKKPPRAISADEMSDIESASIETSDDYDDLDDVM